MPPEQTGAIRSELLRYIDEYRWGWGMARKLINRNYAAHLTDAELKKLYRAGRQ